MSLDLSKLTEKRRNICEAIKRGESIDKIAEMFKMKKSSVKQNLADSAWNLRETNPEIYGPMNDTGGQRTNRMIAALREDAQ